MKRFDDEKLIQIFETRFAVGVPEHVSVAVHETAHPLMAARSLQDVGVLGPIILLHNAHNRFGLHVDGKWYLTFAWSDDFGAYNVRLERR